MGNRWKMTNVQHMLCFCVSCACTECQLGCYLAPGNYLLGRIRECLWECGQGGLYSAAVSPGNTCVGVRHGQGRGYSGMWADGPSVLARAIAFGPRGVFGKTVVEASGGVGTFRIHQGGLGNASAAALHAFVTLLGPPGCPLCSQVGPAMWSKVVQSGSKWFSGFLRILRHAKYKREIQRNSENHFDPL